MYLNYKFYQYSLLSTLLLFFRPILGQFYQKSILGFAILTNENMCHDKLIYTYTYIYIEHFGGFNQHRDKPNKLTMHGVINNKNVSMLFKQIVCIIKDNCGKVFYYIYY